MNELAPVVKVAVFFFLFVGVVGVLMLASALLELLSAVTTYKEDEPYRRVMVASAGALAKSAMKTFLVLVFILVVVVSCGLN